MNEWTNEEDIMDHYDVFLPSNWHLIQCASYKIQEIGNKFREGIWMRRDLFRKQEGFSNFKVLMGHLRIAYSQVLFFFFTDFYSHLQILIHIHRFLFSGPGWRLRPYIYNKLPCNADATDPKSLLILGVYQVPRPCRFWQRFMEKQWGLCLSLAQLHGGRW